MLIWIVFESVLERFGSYLCCAGGLLNLIAQAHLSLECIRDNVRGMYLIAYTHLECIRDSDRGLNLQCFRGCGREMYLIASVG